MPVKPDPLITEELAAMELTIWAAIHPKMMLPNAKTGKLTPREDKSRVIVTLAGPGTVGADGYGATLRGAVDDALRSPRLIDRVPGLKGKMMRLERELFMLRFAFAAQRYTNYGSDEDDDIPF